MDVHARRAGARLIFHGAVVLAFAVIVAGFGYEFAIVSGLMSVDNVNQWRVAHSGSSMNAILAIAGGCAQPFLTLSPAQRGTMGTALAGSVWGNALGYTVGAAVGHRGLTPVCLSNKFPYLWCPEGLQYFGNVLVNASFMMAIVGITVSLYYFVIGASGTMRENSQKRNK